jgi:uncharacterized protein YndB with AHSA1/START domain
MTNTQLTHAAQSETGLLIRRPMREVFEAFANPAITTQFWFTKSSGALAAGQTVEWEWEMYGVSAPVTVLAVEPYRRILIEWPGEKGRTTVEWSFVPYGEGATFITITERGFVGGVDELVRQVAGSTEGFTLVLAGAKALLEHGIRLNLVADRFPQHGEVS